MKKKKLSDRDREWKSVWRHLSVYVNHLDCCHKVMWSGYCTCGKASVIKKFRKRVGL